MTPYPFMARIGLQIAHRERNAALLKAFAEQYPDAEPMGMSEIDGSISFDSGKVDYCRKAFGPEGWATESTYQIAKVVPCGVKVCLDLPRGFQGKKEEVTL